MGRKPQPNETHGSQNDLQILANKHPEILDKKLSDIFNENIKLTWKSPLANEKYIEYVDQKFIDKLGITPEIPLNTFWPKNGPHWDGLAVSGDKVFIMEAKAHIEEQKIDSTDACEESTKLINEALDKTKKYLGVSSGDSWCKDNYYQYANRLAHLYFLRVKNKINAHLLFIYFLNDKSVQENKTELETEEEWEEAKCY